MSICSIVGISTRGCPGSCQWHFALRRFIRGPLGANCEKSYGSGLAVWGSGSRSSGWLVILPPGLHPWQVVFPFGLPPIFMSCSGRSPASPQGQHIVVAAHLPVLFRTSWMAPLGTAGCDEDAVQLITRTIPQSIGKIAKPSLRSAARDCAEADEDIKNLLDRWPEPEHFQLLSSETASLSEEQISLATAYAAFQIYETAATALYLAIMDKMAKVVTGEAPPQNRVRFPEKSHWCASRYFGCLEAVRPGFAPVPGRDAGLWPAAAAAGSGSRVPVGARWRRDAGPRGEARPIVWRSFLKVRCFHSPFGQHGCAGGTV